MRVIAGPRKSSRTTRLIEMAAEFESQGHLCYIICDNHPKAYAIAQKAREMNLNISFPITYDEFVGKRYYGKAIDYFLIDNADHLLQFLSGTVTVAAIVVEAEQIG